MTVYADVLFLVNLSLNWFSLLLTSKIMHRQTKTVRLLIAAAAGALLGFAALFIESRIATALFEIASTFIMCAIAFTGGDLTDYLKAASCLFASGITLGGSLTLLYSFFNRAGFAPTRQNDISASVFMLISLAVTLVTLPIRRFIVSGKSNVDGTLIIEYARKHIELPFMSDSGNLLCEPMSGRPVIIAQKEDLCGIAPSTVLSFDPQSRLCDTASELPKCIRILPVSTAIGKSLLVGFVPDRIILKYRNRTKESDAIIAFGKLPSKSADTYRAIVPAAIL